MSLKHNRTGTHDFSAFAPLVAFGAHLLKTAMRGRQRLVLGKGALASNLAGAIDIGNQPALLAPIFDPTRISKRRASKEIFLEQGSQAFHTGLIEGRKIAGEG
jgi:hypothetical protein